MNAYYRISVKVKPHVQKYLQSIYGNAIIISAENPASMVLYGFLQKKSQAIFPDKTELQKKYALQTKTIYILIQKRKIYNHGISIEPKNHVLINHFFEQQITQLINLIANCFIQINQPRKKTIEYFCKQYNIEIPEDITMDALLKNDWRHSKKIIQIGENNKQLAAASFLQKQ